MIRDGQVSNQIPVGEGLDLVWREGGCGAAPTQDDKRWTGEQPDSSRRGIRFGLEK
jgi:hypothetical protein